MTRLDLFVMRPQEGAHRVAVRAAISVFVPLAMVTLLGHPEWSPYAAFGAFTSLYVRKSVANHLNDIAKDHPGYVVETLLAWRREAKTADEKAAGFDCAKEPEIVGEFAAWKR